METRIDGNTVDGHTSRAVTEVTMETMESIATNDMLSVEMEQPLPGPPVTMETMESIATSDISAVPSPQPSHISESTATGLIKCPMYCRSNCVAQHHPLLVAVLNCVDTEHIELMEMKLGILYNVINKYKQSGQWSSNESISDVIEEYRIPLLHWVCTLGRVGAAIWLVGHNISDPVTRCDRLNGETALHRALRCLQETCPVDASRKFVQLLSVMSPAMSVADDDGNTAFHVCCEMLRGRLPRAEYYKQCLHYMMYELNGDKEIDKAGVADVLNMSNSDGNTVLHLLAENGTNLSEMKPLVQLGADYTLENKAGLTAYEIAVHHSCTTIQSFLERWQGSEPQPVGFILPGTLDPRDSSPFDVKTITDQTEYITESRRVRNLEKFATEKEAMETQDIAMEMGSPSHKAPASRNVSVRDETRPPSDITDLPQYPEPTGDSNTTQNLSPAGLTDPPLDPSPPREPTPPRVPTPPPPIPEIFPQQPEAQEYLEHIVNKRRNLSGGSEVGQKDWDYNEFIMMVQAIDSARHDRDYREQLRTMLEQIEPATVAEYLVMMKESGLDHQNTIDFILDSQTYTEEELELITTCHNGVSLRLEEEQTKQENITSEVTTCFTKLSELSKEEDSLINEVSETSEHSRLAWSANGKLRERLLNTESTLMVLKRLYHETIAQAHREHRHMVAPTRP